MSTSPAAINDRGVAVGHADNRPVRWTAAGERVDLALPPGESMAFAADVNNRGTIVGSTGDGFLTSQAVLWDAAGTVTALGNLPGGDASGVTDVNDRGTVIGAARTADGGWHGVRW